MKQLDKKFAIQFMTLHKVGDLINQTLEQSPKHDVYKPLKPDVVLVDEAGQVLEAHICCAMAPMSDHSRLVQVGDHAQLPATCQSIENKTNSHDRSQFERLFKNAFFDYIMLRSQHRSVPIISAYPSQAFYGSALIDEVCASVPPRKFPYASEPESMVFINEDAEPEKEEGNSFWNPSEVNRVAEVIKSLLEGG